MQSLELWISLAIPVVLIVVGRVVGASIERTHFRDLIERVPFPADTAPKPSGASRSTFPPRYAIVASR